MTLFTPAYRLTCYAPRSVDQSEATILTPAAGAPHSDQFKVTTLPALAGWKPYLGFPRGRRGKIDLLQRTTDIGTLDFEIIDAALTPGTNASRWLTAFFGDTNGDFRFGGLKCFAEESLDGGATWSAFWTGYATRLRAKGANVFVLTVRDVFWDLSRLPVFTSTPHTSVGYVAKPLLLPVGVAGSAYGTIPVAAVLTGTIISPFTVGGSTVANTVRVSLDAASRTRKDNLVTANLLRAVAPDIRVQLTPVLDISVIYPNFAGPCRATVKWAGGASGGDFKVGGLSFTGYGGIPGGLMLSRAIAGGHSALTGFIIQPLDDTTDLGYSALPANGTAVTVTLWTDLRLDDGGKVLLADAHPLTVTQDMLAGKFSPVWRAPERLPPTKVYGDPKRSFSTNISSATIPDLPSARFLIAGSDKALNWLRKNICKPYGVALIVTGAGQVQAVDLRLPTTLAGLTTLTDADLDVAAPVEWQHDRDTAVSRAEGTIYEDLVVQVDALHSMPDAFPDMLALMLSTIDHPIMLLGLGSGDFGDQVFKVEGTGYRTMAGDGLLNGQPRALYLQNQMLQQLNSIRRPYAHGGCTVVLTCRRTTNVQAITQGQVVLATLSKLADPQTYKRGGTRVLRVLERAENGVRLGLTCLDLGTNTVAAVPTLGAPALGSDARHSATVTVTLNASGQPVQVRYALTGTGVGAAPGDTDPSWQAYAFNPVRTTGSITLTGLVPGQRLWVQARTFPDDRVAIQMPSAWVTSASLDLTAYATPSAVSVVSILSQSALVTWTNGATDLLVEVLLSSPTTDPGTRVATLMAGSSRFVLENLAAATQYKVWIQYRSASGVVSGSATAIFTTGSVSVVIPLPPPFYIQPVKLLF